MKPDSDSRLPRSPQDPETLRRLREEALRRLEEEERTPPAPVYGGPPPFPERPAPDYPVPAPVYGGPTMGGGGGSLTRRRTLWGLLLAALGALGGVAAWLFGRRHTSGNAGQSWMPGPVYGGPPIVPPPPQPVAALQALTGAVVTQNGYLLRAVNGGGLGDPQSAPHGVALTTGATSAGPFETFTLIWVDEAKRKFALKTHDGHYVTAVKGGGIGGPDSAQSPLHTNSTDYGPWETFTITLLPDKTHATIQTPDGRHFLSAVNGGGVGGSNQAPLHTNSTQMGAGEVFQLNPARPPERPPAPLYGGPPPRRPG